MEQTRPMNHKMMVFDGVRVPCSENGLRFHKNVVRPQTENGDDACVSVLDVGNKRLPGRLTNDQEPVHTR